jgi:hypothetical protein
MNREIVELLKNIEILCAQFEKEEARPDDPEWVKSHLSLMIYKDQKSRALYVKFLKEKDEESQKALGQIIKQYDAEHQRWLEDWLESHNWPSLSSYGEEPANHAWLIALHADLKVEFQKSVLEKMETLLEREEILPVHCASLRDRIAINEGKPQKWGMFFFLKDGQETLYPVEDPETLEQRRAAFGLDDSARFHR